MVVIERRIENVALGTTWMERGGHPFAEEDLRDVEGLANLAYKAHCPEVGWVLRR